jgi:hypothetical protein
MDVIGIHFSTAKQEYRQRRRVPLWLGLFHSENDISWLLLKGWL